ncbi:hypothetical protein FKP32DRAFT_1597436 [Trametes sanguinea]|nr:hypothetical protein FKP32DRAFT_1597436 [Trametes sanguinea]
MGDLGSEQRDGFNAGKRFALQPPSDPLAVRNTLANESESVPDAPTSEAASRDASYKGFACATKPSVRPSQVGWAAPSLSGEQARDDSENHLQLCSFPGKLQLNSARVNHSNSPRLSSSCLDPNSCAANQPGKSGDHSSFAVL